MEKILLLKHTSLTHLYTLFLIFGHFVGQQQAAAESRAQRAEADLEEVREELKSMTDERDALQRRVTVRRI